VTSQGKENIYTLCDLLKHFTHLCSILNITVYFIFYAMDTLDEEEELLLQKCREDFLSL
jgi:hypothetical protein